MMGGAEEVDPFYVAPASGTRWDPDLNDEAFWRSLGRVGRLALSIHRYETSAPGGGVRSVGEPPEPRPARTGSLTGIRHHPVATRPGYDALGALSAFTPGLS